MTTQTLEAWQRVAFVCCLVLLPQSAGAQIHIPEPGPPVCEAAFCSPRSKHPNMQIDCKADWQCACFDSCGGGSTSSGRTQGSGDGGGVGRLVTSAVVGAAKVIFIVGAPGHAFEALPGQHTTAAEAERLFKEQLAQQEASAQHGKDLAVEVEALRQFRRALEQREENPQRYLRPLFERTPAAPRMDVHDSLQQLRCLDQAMMSARAAANSGIDGDISFLDARRAVDIASGAWDSGLAPAGCGGETIAKTAVAMRTAERQRLVSELAANVEAEVTVRRELREKRAELAITEKKVDEARQSFAAEQEKKRAQVQQAIADAQKDAADKQRAIEEQRQQEALNPPPHRHSGKPESDLMRRLLHASAVADANVDAASQQSQQVTADIAAATASFEQTAAETLKADQARVQAVADKLNASTDAMNAVRGRLGMPPSPR